MKSAEEHAVKTFLVSLCFFVAAITGSVAAREITIDDQRVFPESLGSAHGTLYISSTTKSRIYRAPRGQDFAEPWISKEAGDFHRILGVLADGASNTLWVCDNGRPSAWLKSFNLSTGKAEKSYPFPGGGSCNDIAIAGRAVYATDTAHGRIFKLAPGADTLSTWYENSLDPSFDGLVWARDGRLYFDTYRTHHLYSIQPLPDGSAGKSVLLATDIPLYQPDGLRLSTDGRILLVEGQGRPDGGMKEGRLDEVIPHGDRATIKVLKDGFELPVAVTPEGRMAWVLESKFDYQRNPALRDRDPGSFRVYGVSLNKR